MPAENYYCPDNFFKKMTDLESPKKNNDCYFYYYSTCAKGDSCTFRHEPSALGCETMCSFWKEGKCLNVHCNFRHMELRKNRKVIPCYWESQPVGCLKAHCPFMHQNPRPSDVSVEKSNISAEKSNNDNESNERKVTAVDSLVVNFEEESDNESMPTYSPLKNRGRIVKVKTLEEIKLEKIQAESAAYYSYTGEEADFQLSNDDGDDLRQRIVRRIVSKQSPSDRVITVKPYPNKMDKTINKRLSDELPNILGESSRKKTKIIHQKNNGDFQITLNKSVPDNKASYGDSLPSKFTKNIFQKQEDVKNIKIKTLAEIRAERNARRDDLSTDNFQGSTVRLDEQEEAEVSSTSVDENLHRYLHEDKNKSETGVGIKKKIKLRRKLTEENVVSSNDRDDDMISSNEQDIVSSKHFEESILSEQDDILEQSNKSVYSKNLRTKYLPSDSDKIDEDILLLDDDEEEYEDVSFKAEDELLDEINSFIDD